MRKVKQHTNLVTFFTAARAGPTKVFQFVLKQVQCLDQESCYTYILYPCVISLLCNHARRSLRHVYTNRICAHARLSSSWLSYIAERSCKVCLAPALLMRVRFGRAVDRMEIDKNRMEVAKFTIEV